MKTYKNTKFALDTSQYDQAKADRAVSFIQALSHTKGIWARKPFLLLPWQEMIIRDIFGTVKPNGYRQFNTAYIEIPKKMGKQVALNTLIPTPEGFTTMGKISVGDLAFDENGQTCNVVAKSNVDYDEQAYRITFKDGEVIEAGANHQWYGEWRSNKGLKSGTVNKDWLYRRSQCLSRIEEHKIDFRIHINNALEINNIELPIAPYLMGYWLGNGHHCKPEITIMTSDVEEVLSKIRPYHEIQSIWDNVGNSKCIRIPDLKKALFKSFHDKVIPSEYLRASREQRLFVLQGLIDSDGCISDRKGQANYCSTEKKLAESVSELLWSLGIKNAISLGVCTQRSDWSKTSIECGRVHSGEILYYVKFTAFSDTRIAGLERKQSNSVTRDPKSRSHYRYIEKIEPIENRGMQCIQVDSPSHQYLIGRSCLPTHNSELAAAIALFLLAGDMEERAEIYGCAADRQQASIVFEVAADMVRFNQHLAKALQIFKGSKRIIDKKHNSFYQVLSAESYSKHGFNVHGVIFDELHTQPDRKLFDVMTKGSGDARAQPLYFLITTAGSDNNSICYEVHQKALDILEGRKTDPTFYPVIYGAADDDDWTDPDVWKKANPSLGVTVDIEKVEAACESAKQNPAEENAFRQLRLNQWVKQSIRWMPMISWDACKAPVDEDELYGRVCYAGLDLSSTTDVTAFVLVFPPRVETEKYVILPYFWMPEDNIDLRVRRDHVQYDLWARQGYMKSTEGNVIHYGFIETFIEQLGKKYNIREIAFDRWGATQMSYNLAGMGFTVVPFGQGFKDMTSPTKELMRLVLSKEIMQDGHPVLRWMMDNIFIKTDPAGNIKPDKEKSSEKIDGVVALVMALDRALKGEGEPVASVYEERGLLIL